MINDMISTMGTATRVGWRAWTQTTVTIFFMIVLSGMAEVASAQSSPPKARALFVFGDSWADTGNQNKSTGGCWQPPYGETWPGRPTGRCGNGHIQTDYIADIIGLPTPTSYVNSAVDSIATGINFAIAGSSVTYALGVFPLGTQVDNFELVQQSGVYDASVLSQSIAFVSLVGNDFTSNLTGPELLEIAQTVVEGINVSLTRLYELGIRNFLVSNLAPLNCLPTVTYVNNFTYCPTATDPIIAYQNNLLEQSIAELNKRPGGNFLILDNFKAFSDVLNNSAAYGITEKFVPCCVPLLPTARCGSLDASGNPLYTLCDDPATHTFWDLTHPVESTWGYVTNHFAVIPGFVLGARTLTSWLEQNTFRPASAPGPAPAVPLASAGAAGELDRAYQALINQTDYAETVGLLRGMDLESFVTNLPAQMVTIFLPNNVAYTKYTQAFLDQIYAEDKIFSVAVFHVVEGFFDSDRLSGSPPMNFTTITGLQLVIDPTPTGILVGPSPASVVSPDLYIDPGQVVIHGIDNILLPPNLVIT